MEPRKHDDLVGRHLIVDASTYSKRNLTSTDTAFALFEALNRQLDMTAVLPPIVCRYPFVNNELSAFCDDIETELASKAKALAASGGTGVDLSLAPVRVMREFLRRRQLEDSGVTGVSIWSESHAAIHTWDEDDYYAFDAFSCRDFEPRDALRVLLTHFDVETLNCVNLFRYQRSAPRVSNFQVDRNWDVLVDGRVVGDLESVAFRAICPREPADAGAASPPVQTTPAATARPQKPRRGGARPGEDAAAGAVASRRRDRARGA